MDLGLAGKVFVITAASGGLGRYRAAFDSVVVAAVRTARDVVADMGASAPLGRVGQPPEFGKVAALLLSEAASYITGCVIPVDGGRLRGL